MSATIVGSQLHCGVRSGLRLYVNTAMVEIDQNTDVECQLNRELRMCNLVSAEPPSVSVSVCLPRRGSRLSDSFPLLGHTRTGAREPAV